jgi:S1-C subfamily serine protease
MAARPMTRWRARNIASGDEVARVRSEGARASPIVAACSSRRCPSLGFVTVARAGVEVVGVEPRSRADRAGNRSGDLITVFGPEKTPTATQITRAFDTLKPGERVLVAMTRGNGHHVVVVEKHLK